VQDAVYRRVFRGVRRTRVELRTLDAGSDEPVRAKLALTSGDGTSGSAQWQGCTVPIAQLYRDAARCS